MNRTSNENQKEEDSPKEVQKPRRSHLYDQLNINEQYLDYFIVGTIVLLFGILIYGLI